MFWGAAQRHTLTLVKEGAYSATPQNLITQSHHGMVQYG